MNTSIPFQVNSPTLDIHERIKWLYKSQLDHGLFIASPIHTAHHTWAMFHQLRSLCCSIAVVAGVRVEISFRPRHTISSCSSGSPSVSATLLHTIPHFCCYTGPVVSAEVDRDSGVWEVKRQQESSNWNGIQPGKLCCVRIPTRNARGSSRAQLP